MKDLTMENISGTWYQSASKNEQKIFRDWLHGLLKTDTVDLTFVKKDDTIREMKCTLMESKLPAGYVVDPEAEIHENYIHIFDNNQNKYINYYCKLEYPIPLFGQAVIQKLQPFIEKAGHLLAIKTNLPSITSLFSDNYSNTFPYPNIKTCILNGLQPELSINYSNIT
jgi:hypothetical protein